MQQSKLTATCLQPGVVQFQICIF